jgi:hypothetical protein
MEGIRQPLRRLNSGLGRDYQLDKLCDSVHSCKGNGSGNILLHIVFVKSTRKSSVSGLLKKIVVSQRA